MKITELFRGKVGNAATQTSQSVCLAPIAGCLLACEEVVGTNGIWNPTNNPNQKVFLGGYYNVAREQVKGLPELESIASPNAEVINAFLQKRGFQIRLQPLVPPSIGIASVFKLLLEWTRPGIETVIREERYPAVNISLDQSFFSSSHVPNPIVSVTTKNEDIIRMTVLDNPPSEFKLLELVQNIDASLSPLHNKFSNVIFPMIDYDEEIDIAWAQGMATYNENGPWVISQAVQQTKFRMNELGAKVESAVAMGIRFGYCPGRERPPDLIIDQPFLLWINRDGLSHPLFIGYFMETDWKKPKSL